MYKSYHYNNMPQPITVKRECEPEASPPKEEVCEKDAGFFGNLKNDDIILLVIIFFLLIDDCDDKLLLAALGFIFFSGFGE